MRKTVFWAYWSLNTFATSTKSTSTRGKPVKWSRTTYEKTCQTLSNSLRRYSRLRTKVRKPTITRCSCLKSATLKPLSLQRLGANLAPQRLFQTRGLSVTFSCCFSQRSSFRKQSISCWSCFVFRNSSRPCKIWIVRTPFACKAPSRKISNSSSRSFCNSHSCSPDSCKPATHNSTMKKMRISSPRSTSPYSSHFAATMSVYSCNTMDLLSDSFAFYRALRRLEIWDLWFSHWSFG